MTNSIDPNMVPHNLKIILAKLIDSGILSETMTTQKVVRYLNSKEYHRAKLYRPEYQEILGRRRKGGGKNYEFDTLKVIAFDLELQGTINFPS